MDEPFGAPGQGDDNLPYNINTAVGQVRFHAADTDVASAIFDDAEVRYALSLSSGDARYAAAYLLEAAATDKAKIALAVKIGSLAVDAGKVSELLANRAAQLRLLAPGPVTLDTPDRIFSTDSQCHHHIGTMSGW